MLRIGSAASCSQTRAICSVTLPKKVADRSPLPSLASRMRCTYVPGLVDSASLATSASPSRSKSSPRPCQITRGSWIPLAASVADCHGSAIERALVASAAKSVIERMLNDGTDKGSSRCQCR